MEPAELVVLGLPGAAAGAPESEAGGETPDASPPVGSLGGGDLARLRGVLIEANPEAVHELIGGDDLDALLASVETARAAYARVKEDATRAALAGIPRGGGTRALDPAVYAGLSPEGKIALGLSRGE